MILQRYTFGSKSQLKAFKNSPCVSCLWYCKDIHLEANHNHQQLSVEELYVAYDIAKIYIWKQITTYPDKTEWHNMLLMILQRYTFGSKSQPNWKTWTGVSCCLWYCKDIHLEANHNSSLKITLLSFVAYDIAKIYIWKQITTTWSLELYQQALLMILQR